MIGPIAGILASNVSITREYFTTVLYPFAVTDELSMQNAGFSSSPGNLWQSPRDDASVLHPTILSGSLIPSIVYKTYSDGVIEDMSISAASILSGSLVPTIVYKTYTMVTEDMSVAAPAILSGSMTVTISYVNYTNGATENMEVAAPTILSGTLT